MHGITFFKYEAVHYDPLDEDEALSCLFSLVKEVATTIEALHRLGFAHQDVRLPNICFSSQFKPVLIDIDRMCINDQRLEYPNGATLSVQHRMTGCSLV